jgi:uncharacterized protein
MARAEPSRALIDTGALLALANPRDQYHAQAVAIGRRQVARGARWLGSTLVLGEFHAHVLRLRGATVARELLQALLDDPAYEWIETSVSLIESALALWLDRFRDRPCSLTDAVSFELMQRERIQSAFAFDNDFVTAGYELLSA